MPPESASLSQPRRRFSRFPITCALLFLALSLLALLVALFAKPSAKIIWLNPETAFHPTLPGPPSRLKDKLATLPGIVTYWQRHRPQTKLLGHCDRVQLAG